MSHPAAVTTDRSVDMDGQKLHRLCSDVKGYYHRVCYIRSILCYNITHAVYMVTSGICENPDRM